MRETQGKGNFEKYSILQDQFLVIDSVTKNEIKENRVKTMPLPCTLQIDTKSPDL